jgi:pimeloyl-ACP methyl ester carboxylesterase
MLSLATNRTIVRANERFAPRLGARAAVRLWFTVPPAIPRARIPALPPGRDARVELAGVALHSTVWGAGPPVYLVHGWGGRSEQLGGFVAPLVAAGFTVVAVDAPAHGASGPGRHGRSSTIPEFAATLRAAVEAHGRPHAVIAHSLGATAAAYALGEGVRPDRLVLLAPVADPRRMLAVFADQLGLGPRVRAGTELQVRRIVGRPFAAFDLPAMARTAHLPPTLIVHDRTDPEVALAHGRDIARAWPGSRLLVTDGLGHRRLLRDSAVLSDVVGFVAATASERRSA